MDLRERRQRCGRTIEAVSVPRSTSFSVASEQKMLRRGRSAARCKSALRRSHDRGRMPVTPLVACAHWQCGRDVLSNHISDDGEAAERHTRLTLWGHLRYTFCENGESFRHAVFAVQCFTHVPVALTGREHSSSRAARAAGSLGCKSGHIFGGRGWGRIFFSNRP